MTADANATYAAVVAELTATSPAMPGKMFSMPCLKNANGKVFAGLYHGALVFKLPAPIHGEALALAGAHLFDPSGKGHPMKEWVVTPDIHAEQGIAFARVALAYVSGAV